MKKLSFSNLSQFSNIHGSQYSSFLLELNLMKKAWKPYGVNVEISAPGLRKIILFGTRTGIAGKD